MNGEIVISFGGAFLLSILGSLLIIRIGKLKYFRRPNEKGRRSHLVPRLGGLAIGLSVLVVVAILWERFLIHELLALVVGGALVLSFGVADDLKILSWKAQLVSQVVLSLFLFIVGMRIDSLPLPNGGRFFFTDDILSLFLQAAILLAWVLLIMNSVNWIDGSDGLSGSVVFIALVVIFFLAIQPDVHQGGVALIAAIGGGAILGFLLFNWPPAHLHAGTSGAYFLGFLVAYLSVVAGTKIASAALVLAIPLLDALRVIGSRLRRGTPIFLPDESHVHHELASLGMGKTAVLLLLSSFTLGAGVLAVLTERVDKFLGALVVAVFVLGFEFFVEYQLSRKRQAAHL